MKATLGKRVLTLEQVVTQQYLRRSRSLDYNAITNDELAYLAWIAEQRLDHGADWIETTLSPQELADLDAVLARIVVLPE